MSTRTLKALRRPRPTHQVPGSTQEKNKKNTRSLCGRGGAAGVLVRLTIEVHHCIMVCFNILPKLDLGCHFRDYRCSLRRTCFQKIATPHLTFSDPMFPVEVGSTINAVSRSPKSVVARRPLRGRLSRQSLAPYFYTHRLYLHVHVWLVCLEMHFRRILWRVLQCMPHTHVGCHGLPCSSFYLGVVFDLGNIMKSTLDSSSHFGHLQD